MERIDPAAVYPTQPERDKWMPILLWLLGVPIVVIVLLYLFNVI
jgi:hypothetical protein